MYSAIQRNRKLAHAQQRWRVDRANTFTHSHTYTQHTARAEALNSTLRAIHFNFFVCCFFCCFISLFFSCLDFGVHTLTRMIVSLLCQPIQTDAHDRSQIHATRSFVRSLYFSLTPSCDDVSENRDSQQQNNTRFQCKAQKIKSNANTQHEQTNERKRNTKKTVQRQQKQCLLMLIERRTGYRALALCVCVCIVGR